MGRAFLSSGLWSGLTLSLNVAGTKLLALAAGPSGMGRYGLFIQVMQAALMVASLGGAAALMQGLSSRPVAQHMVFMKTVLRTHLISMVLAILGTAGWLWLLAPAPIRTALPTPLALSLAPLVALGTWQALMVGRMGARMAVGLQGLAYAIGAGATLLVTAATMPWLRTGEGWPFAVMVGANLVVSIVVGERALRRQSPNTSLGSWPEGARTSRAYPVVALAAMAAGIVAPLALVCVRAGLAGRDGLEAAGLFHAAWIVANGYMLTVLSTFAGHLLPLLAAAREPAERGPLLDQALGIVGRWVAPLATLGVGARDMVLALLFAPTFQPAGDLLRWLLPAALCRSVGWVLAMPLSARAHLRPMVGVELLAGLAMVVPLVFVPGSQPVLYLLGPAVLAGAVAHALASGVLAIRFHGWAPRPQVIRRLVHMVLVVGAVALSTAVGTERLLLGVAGALLLVGLDRLREHGALPCHPDTEETPR